MASPSTKASPLEQQSDIAALRAALPGYLRLALVYLLCAWLAYNIYQTIHWIVAYYCPLPVQDYWRVPQNLAEYQHFHLGVLWRQHNEHRIIFPEILYAIDILMAHGRMILPIVCSCIAYSLVWGVLSLTVMGDSGMSLYERVLAILVAGTIVLWQGSAVFLAQPFLLQWPLMQLGVVLSLFLLKRSAETSNKFFLAGSIAAAVVATYSSANALLLWPLLLGVAFLIRLPRRFLAALGISAVVFLGLFFVGYQFSAQTNLRALVMHPLYSLGFFASYLSMPLGGIRSPAFGILIGLLLSASLCFLFILTTKARLLRSSPAIVLFGYFVFCLLTILITAAGRMEPDDPIFTAAKFSRYLSVPLINWGAFALLCFWLSARLKWRVFTTQRLVVASAALVLFGQYKLRPWQEFNSYEFADEQMAALSVEDGLLDSQLLTRIFPSPEFVRGNLPTLKANHLSIFYGGHEQSLGKNPEPFGKMKSQPVVGEITYTLPVEHGVAVVGWADQTDERNPWPWIILVNERGQIAGFGRRLPAGFPTALQTNKTPEKEAWVGFVGSAMPYRTISAYLATRHSLEPIQGPVPIPTLQAASGNEIGVPLKDVAWRMDSSWKTDSIPVPMKYGWLPGEPIYSSLTKVKMPAGQIAAEFPAPANACVLLPILHGRSITGATAELRDADTNQVLARLPLKIQDPLWATWRITLDVAVKRLLFVATDAHQDLGQWLAVATPLECK